jgi:threonine dehydrogenase-like Zn-dependent dehydrogenase
LHILGGDVPEIIPGGVLGHEAVGTVTAIGSGVQKRAVGDRVLISCITSCGSCRDCREGSCGQCLGGGGSPKRSRTRRQVWRPDQIQSFLTSVREDRFAALFLLELTTGIRRGQVCGLKWTSVDLDAHTCALQLRTSSVFPG